jgi:hypothetical protein
MRLMASSMATLGDTCKTGLKLAPDFNSYTFNIGEAGYAWRAVKANRAGSPPEGGIRLDTFRHPLGPT